jgi:hypothetical protein
MRRDQACVPPLRSLRSGKRAEGKTAASVGMTELGNGGLAEEKADPSRCLPGAGRFGWQEWEIVFSGELFAGDVRKDGGFGIYRFSFAGPKVYLFLPMNPALAGVARNREYIGARFLRRQSKYLTCGSGDGGYGLAIWSGIESNSEWTILSRRKLSSVNRACDRRAR